MIFLHLSGKSKRSISLWEKCIHYWVFSLPIFSLLILRDWQLLPHCNNLGLGPSWESDFSSRNILHMKTTWVSDGVSKKQDGSIGQETNHLFLKFSTFFVPLLKTTKSGYRKTMNWKIIINPPYCSVFFWQIVWTNISLFQLIDCKLERFFISKENVSEHAHCALWWYLHSTWTCQKALVIIDLYLLNF